MAISKQMRLVLIIGGAALGAAAFGFLAIFFHRSFDSMVKVRALAGQLGLYAPVGMIVLQTVQIILAPVPGMIFSVASGYLFGVAKGTLVTMAGVIIGSSIVLVLSRKVGRRLVVRFVKKATLDKWDGRFQKWGLIVFFILYLVPNPLGDIVSYLAGLTGWPLPALLSIVVVGRLPGVIVSCYLGHRASSLTGTELVILGGTWLVLAAGFFLVKNRLEKLFFKK